VNQPARTLWTTESTDAVKTGTWRVALPAYVNPPAPCHNACPVDGNIAVWIQHIKNRAYRDAWLTLIENNPLPAVTGRICHRPCEDFASVTGPAKTFVTGDNSTKRLLYVVSSVSWATWRWTRDGQSPAQTYQGRKK
jgi:hypothetical protein